jgi:hypothetical protein
MTINERTTLPVWWIFAALPTFVGLVVWISFIAFRTYDNTAILMDLRIEQRTESKSLLEQNKQVLDRLSRIEEQLKYLQQQRR